LAEQMAEQGADAGKIWEETGWWVPTPNGPRPPGGAPRYEIPDPLPNVPLKRVTEEGASAATVFEQRAKVMKEAADLRDFAEANKLNVQEALAQMKELGFDMPSREAIQQAMTPYSTASMKQQAESAARRAAVVKERPGTLAERLEHPALYEAYPQLKDMDVRLVEPDVLRGARGQLDPATKTISIDRTLPDEEALSVLLHEAQHGVQDLEPGFSKGGSVAGAPGRVAAATQSRLASTRELLRRRTQGGEEGIEAMAEELGLDENQKQSLLRRMREDQKRLAELEEGLPPPEVVAKWESMAPFKQYRHLGGEAEARIVQHRQKMREPGRIGLAARVAPYATPEQKRKVYPWTEIGGLDVPLEYLIP
jgi:hypothetical protein